MSERKRAEQKEELSNFFGDEVQDVLNKTFYKTEQYNSEGAPIVRESMPVLKAPRVPRIGFDTKINVKQKPDHYEIICISMYKEDLKEMDEKVSALKQRGLRKMNRSALIRYALSHVNPDDVPRNGW